MHIMKSWDLRPASLLEVIPRSSFFGYFGSQNEDMDSSVICHRGFHAFTQFGGQCQGRCQTVVQTAFLLKELDRGLLVSTNGESLKLDSDFFRIQRDPKGIPCHLRRPIPLLRTLKLCKGDRAGPTRCSNPFF